MSKHLVYQQATDVADTDDLMASMDIVDRRASLSLRFNARVSQLEVRLFEPADIGTKA